MSNFSRMVSLQLRHCDDRVIEKILFKRLLPAAMNQSDVIRAAIEELGKKYGIE